MHVRNVMALTMIGTVVDPHVLVEKTGLENEIMHDAINRLRPGLAGVIQTGVALLTRTANGAHLHSGEDLISRVELGRSTLS
jgi:hypothetical protein